MAVLCCWSAKGGVGTSLVVALLAGALVSEHGSSPVIVDLDGDLSDALEPAGDRPPGVAEWLAEGGSPPPDALARLERDGRGPVVLPRGTGPLRADAVPLLVQVLRASGRVVIIDAGRLRPDEPGSAAGIACAARSDRAWVVTDARRASVAVLARPAARATGVVVMASRPLALPRVSSLPWPAPVVADIGFDPRLGRAAERDPLAVCGGAGPARALRRAAEHDGLLISFHP